MAVTVLVVWDVVALALVIVSVALMLVSANIVVDVLVALTVITTVGLAVIKALSPDRDGTRLISSVIKAFISEEEICSRAALLLSA